MSGAKGILQEQDEKKMMYNELDKIYVGLMHSLFLACHMKCQDELGSALKEAVMV
jgi:hypothetical protein